MFNLQWVRQHFLAIAATCAAIWWITAGEAVQDLAFYTFVVLYGGYYVLRTRQRPMTNLRLAKSQLIFDVILVGFVMVPLLTSSASVLSSAAAVIFILAIGGADLRQYLILRRQAK